MPADADPRLSLRYGVNPYQGRASLQAGGDGPLPLVRNGSPSYINLLDALTGWQLVRDLQGAFGEVAAASLKHTTPIGAGVGSELGPTERAVALLPEGSDLSPCAAAYVKARNGDRVAAYGDFVAVSEPVDRSLAEILAREVSDGIIAPGYDPDALGILSRKKGGSYLVLEMDRDFVPSELEERMIFGLRLHQERNQWLPPVPAGDAVARSLALAQLVAKYTVSNAFVVAVPGQVVAVAAGQQSRVDAAGVAAHKIRRWWLRRQPKLLAAQPPEGVKRYEWDNMLALVASGRRPELEAASPLAELAATLAASEDEQAAQLARPPQPLVAASDGSIPFPDAIEILAGAGVQILSQPGGSVRDEEIARAAKNVGLEVVVTGVRLFYH